MSIGSEKEHRNGSKERSRLCAGFRYARPGRPSLPRALKLGAAHDLSAPLRDAAAVLWLSRALIAARMAGFRRTTDRSPVGRGSPIITWPACRCPCRWPAATARTYASRGLRAPRFALPGAQRGCKEDFHPQVNAPCRAHQHKAAILQIPASGSMLSANMNVRSRHPYRGLSPYQCPVVIDQ